MGRGRPPTLSDDKLIKTLEQTLNWPVIAAVSTGTVAAELTVSQPTVLNRLKAAREDNDVPIEGFQPGEQGGYVWWLTDADLY